MKIFKIICMYIVNLLILATVTLPNHKNIVTVVCQQFSKNTIIPGIWLALVVLILFLLADLLNKKDSNDIYFNRLRSIMMLLIFASLATSIFF
ncbi:conserved membrane hypothetical protein [Oenococcus oeni]|uniref:hypothetical protein n=1 Tax=Oenococcus oeni TaxID=1247 RepID=UPI0010B4D929|nr:hypothetical protein [Oenococcus oeni]SYW03038.1 conserved membrane hypothetical protein [Oenococcus oeni]